MCAGDRPISALDLPCTVSHPGVDPALEGSAMQYALRRAVVMRRGYCSWDVGHASRVVTVHSPGEQDFHDKTLKAALTWCLVWLITPELGIEPFLA
jgi:hypothetical protein